MTRPAARPVTRPAAPPAARRADLASAPSLSAHARAVLDTLRAAHHHPTAAELYDDVRRAHPRLGRATVYRALAALEAAGLVAEVWRDALGRHYDARTDAHDHAVCDACGRVFDVERPPLALPPEYVEAAGAHGHAVRGYAIRYYGVCAACRAAGRTGPAIH
jgi:Fe2+ or Zn2+ uptake regulation protein